MLLMMMIFLQHSMTVSKIILKKWLEMNVNMVGVLIRLVLWRFFCFEFNSYCYCLNFGLFWSILLNPKQNSDLFALILFLIRYFREAPFLQQLLYTVFPQIVRPPQLEQPPLLLRPFRWGLKNSTAGRTIWGNTVIYSL